MPSSRTYFILFVLTIWSSLNQYYYSYWFIFDKTTHIDIIIEPSFKKLKHIFNYQNYQKISLRNKRVLCNWPCNSLNIQWNSLYIWCNSLQLNQNNSFSTTMQFHYKYTYDVILMSLIVIHLLKSDMWHHEDFLP